MKRLTFSGAIGPVVLVGALVLGGCGSGGKSASATKAASAGVTTVPPTTTAAAPAGAPNGPAAGSGGGGAPAAAPAGATQPAARPGTPGAGRPSGGASPSAAAAPATPVPTGTYRYDTSGSSQSSGGSARPMPAVTTLRADGPTGASQHTTRDLRDQNGQGQTIETVLVYQPDGVHLSSIKVTTVLGGGITDVRDLHADPPPLIGRTGGTPGDHYEFTLTGSGTTFHGTLTVQRTEQLTIGGQAMTTAVVHLHIDFSGAVTGQQDATDWVEPTHLLTVKEQVVTDAHAGALTTHTEYTATLQHLQPS